MEFKVKEVTKEEKSRVEVENELLKKHEEKFEDSGEEKVDVDKVNLSEGDSEVKSSEPETKEVIEEDKVSEINDTDVLSYIKNRYDKDIKSVDDLFAEKEANLDLPEDVSAYFKYKQETGRGINDFYKLQKDIDAMDDNAVLANYYESTEDGLDSDDIRKRAYEEIEKADAKTQVRKYHKRKSRNQVPVKKRRRVFHVVGRSTKKWHSSVLSQTTDI